MTAASQIALPGELRLCPFERSVVGMQGHVMLRRNHDHAQQCVKAIRRRAHPAWSAFNDSFTVACHLQAVP